MDVALKSKTKTKTKRTKNQKAQKPNNNPPPKTENNFSLLYDLSVGVKKKRKRVFFLVPAGVRAAKGWELAEVWRLPG